MKELKDFFTRHAAKEEPPAALEKIETLEPFMATINSIQRQDKNGVKGYEMVLKAEGVEHLVAAVAIEPMQRYSATSFDSLKAGDIVKVGVVSSCIMGGAIPVSILGTVEKMPGSASLANKKPPQIGYRQTMGG